MTSIRQYIDILNEYLLIEDYKTAKTAFVDKGANAEDVDRVFAVYRDLANRNQITGNEKNIDWWAKNKTWEELVKFVHEKSKVKSITQLKRSKIVGDSITLHEDDDWLVVVPLDKDASCFHGRDTDWCTAKPFQSNFEDYFYESEITLIYCINKKDSSKYAIAWPSKFDSEDFSVSKRRIEFFDKTDKQISFDKFVSLTGLNPKNLIEKVQKDINSKTKASRQKYKEIKNEIEKKLQTNISADDISLIKQLAYIKSIDLSIEYFEKIFNSDQKPTSYAIKILAQPAVGLMISRIFDRRWPEVEPVIMKDAGYAYSYAQDVLKDRWPEAEPVIMKNPSFAYSYAEDVIRGRWPEAEPYIMKDPEAAYNYANDIIRGRWPEAEPYIMKDPDLYRRYKIRYISDLGF